MFLWHVWQMCRFWPIRGQQRLKPHPLLLRSKNQDVVSRESGAVVRQQGPEFNCSWGPGAFWSLHVLPVPMWDSKLTWGVCGCLILYVSPVLSPRNYRIREPRVMRQRKRTTKARESLKWLKTDRACVRLPGFRRGCCMFYFRTSGSRQSQPVCSE